MPSFEKAKKNARQNAGGNLPAKVPDAQVDEPRCHVCQHKKRHLIDKQLVKGTKFAEIGRIFGIDRRSVSNHYRNHLNLEDAAMTRIIEREAAIIGEDFEEGVQGVLARRVYLETALKKAQEALLNEDITVEPKDAVAIIEKLDKMESESSEAIIAQMKIELAAYIQAMKEVVPGEMWINIQERMKELVQRADSIAEIESNV